MDRLDSQRIIKRCAINIKASSLFHIFFQRPFFQNPVNNTICDMCRKKDVKTYPIHSEYATKYVKKICDDCGKIIDRKNDSVQRHLLIRKLKIIRDFIEKKQRSAKMDKEKVKTTIQINQEAIDSMRMTEEEFREYKKKEFEEDLKRNRWKYESLYERLYERAIAAV